jgi:hypothetical protein
MTTKIFAMVLLKRSEGARDEPKRENQCGFCRGRACTDQILTLRLILQQYERYNLPIINLFPDFVTAFDSATRENHWRIMVENGFAG